MEALKLMVLNVPVETIELPDAPYYGKMGLVILGGPQDPADECVLADIALNIAEDER